MDPSAFIMGLPSENRAPDDAVGFPGSPAAPTPAPESLPDEPGTPPARGSALPSTDGAPVGFPGSPAALAPADGSAVPLAEVDVASGLAQKVDAAITALSAVVPRKRFEEWALEVFDVDSREFGVGGGPFLQQVLDAYGEQLAKLGVRSLDGLRAWVIRELADDLARDEGSRFRGILPYPEGVSEQERQALHRVWYHKIGNVDSGHEVRHVLLYVLAGRLPLSMRVHHGFGAPYDIISPLGDGVTPKQVLFLENGYLSFVEPRAEDGSGIADQIDAGFPQAEIAPSRRRELDGEFEKTRDLLQKAIANAEEKNGDSTYWRILGNTFQRNLADIRRRLTFPHRQVQELAEHLRYFKKLKTQGGWVDQRPTDLHDPFTIRVRATEMSEFTPPAQVLSIRLADGQPPHREFVAGLVVRGDEVNVTFGEWGGGFVEIRYTRPDGTESAIFRRIGRQLTADELKVLKRMAPGRAWTTGRPLFVESYRGTASIFNRQLIVSLGGGVGVQGRRPTVPPGVMVDGSEFDFPEMNRIRLESGFDATGRPMVVAKISATVGGAEQDLYVEVVNPAPTAYDIGGFPGKVLWELENQWDLSDSEVFEDTIRAQNKLPYPLSIGVGKGDLIGGGKVQVAVGTPITFWVGKWPRLPASELGVFVVVKVPLVGDNNRHAYRLFNARTTIDKFAELMGTLRRLRGHVPAESETGPTSKHRRTDERADDGPRRPRRGRGPALERRPVGPGAPHGNQPFGSTDGERSGVGPESSALRDDSPVLLDISISDWLEPEPEQEVAEAITTLSDVVSGDQATLFEKWALEVFDVDPRRFDMGVAGVFQPVLDAFGNQLAKLKVRSLDGLRAWVIRELADDLARGDESKFREILPYPEGVSEKKEREALHRNWLSKVVGGGVHELTLVPFHVLAEKLGPMQVHHPFGAPYRIGPRPGDGVVPEQVLWWRGAYFLVKPRAGDGSGVADRIAAGFPQEAIDPSTRRKLDGVFESTRRLLQAAIAKAEKNRDSAYSRILGNAFRRDLAVIRQGSFPYSQVQELDAHLRYLRNLKDQGGWEDQRPSNLDGPFTIRVPATPVRHDPEISGFTRPVPGLSIWLAGQEVRLDGIDGLVRPGDEVDVTFGKIGRRRGAGFVEIRYTAPDGTESAIFRRIDREFTPDELKALKTMAPGWAWTTDRPLFVESFRSTTSLRIHSYGGRSGWRQLGLHLSRGVGVKGRQPILPPGIVAGGGSFDFPETDRIYLESGFDAIGLPMMFAEISATVGRAEQKLYVKVVNPALDVDDIGGIFASGKVLWELENRWNLSDSVAYKGKIVSQNSLPRPLNRSVGYSKNGKGDLTFGGEEVQVAVGTEVIFWVGKWPRLPASELGIFVVVRAPLVKGPGHAYRLIDTGMKIDKFGELIKKLGRQRNLTLLGPQAEGAPEPIGQGPGAGNESGVGDESGAEGGSGAGDGSLPGGAAAFEWGPVGGGSSSGGGKGVLPAGWAAGVEPSVEWVGGGWRVSYRSSAGLPAWDEMTHVFTDRFTWQG
ncbi:hypothetical protein ACGFIZ_33960, partial [Micromonospora sp. NPDC048830]